ncbi:MAG: hypothetical protein U1F77_15305 [Kiritimatiellia bacterium]
MPAACWAIWRELHFLVRFLGAVGAAILVTALPFIALISLPASRRRSRSSISGILALRVYEWLRLHLKRGPPLGEEEERELLALNRRELKEKNRKAALTAAGAEESLPHVAFEQDDGKPAVATLVSDEPAPARPAPQTHSGAGARVGLRRGGDSLAPHPQHGPPRRGPEDRRAPACAQAGVALRVQAAAAAPAPPVEPPPVVAPVPPPMPGQYTLPPLTLLDHIPSARAGANWTSSAPRRSCRPR